ncbi:MAG TPA: hypothetical protein VNU24_07550 [Solirubrobacteraceae bacterium]|nr:hypothetical protein [Solirubrobacteraceae bacterium]
MTRTTLDLDASILAQLRRRARAEHKSMGQLASEQLAASLGERASSEQPPLHWPSRHMGKPAVDLDDKEALWRLLDEEQMRRPSR